MYAVTSTPEERRTRATLRRAEFGFLGVVVYTRVHTPRRWGAPFRAGVLVLVTLACRPLRTSWAIVGTRYLSLLKLQDSMWRTKRDGQSRTWQTEDDSGCLGVRQSRTVRRGGGVQAVALGASKGGA